MNYLKMATNAKLIYCGKDGRKLFAELSQEQTTLGRRDDNHVFLPDELTSKYHAIVIKTDNHYYLKDRNSANGLIYLTAGVRINEKIIAPDTLVELRDRDVISIGSFNLLFILNADIQNYSVDIEKILLKGESKMKVGVPSDTALIPKLNLFSENKPVVVQKMASLNKSITTKKNRRVSDGDIAIEGAFSISGVHTNKIPLTKPGIRRNNIENMGKILSGEELSSISKEENGSVCSDFSHSLRNKTLVPLSVPEECSPNNFHPKRYGQAKVDYHITQKISGKIIETKNIKSPGIKTNKLISIR